MGRQLKRNKNRKSHAKVIVFVILCVIALAATGIYFGFRVTNIEYSGNKHYDEQQMDMYLFNGHNPNALLYVLFGKKKEIPFIQKYDVEIQWPNKMSITVYEKAIVGYINYMGCNMYFDKDGTIVESSSDVYSGVPQITGLTFKSIVLDSKLNVGNDKVFSQILEMTQTFDKYNLSVDKVYYDPSYEVTLYMGNVKVILGDASDCMDKLYALKQMSDKLTGMKGTLHLEDYNGSSASVIFKKEN
jgi:cell division protein FtsQ